MINQQTLEDFDVFSNFRAFPMLYGWQENL